MRFSIVAAGKMKPPGLREAMDDYLGRIRRFYPCDEIELRDGPDAAARFRKAIPARARVVALVVDGRTMDSHGLARFVSRCERDAVPYVAWLLGGAYGLPAEVVGAADLQLSLSAMTFPHRLARVVLAEQLYRACTINRNEPYAH